MAGIAQNGQKMPYFHCGPSAKTQKTLKRDGKKIERYIQSIKNLYKLKWLTL